MSIILLIIMLSVVVEALIQYAKSIAGAFDSKDWKTAITQLFSVAIGITISFSTGADMFAALGISFDWPAIGVVLTGIFMSRGSNYLADLIKRLQSVGKD